MTDYEHIPTGPRPPQRVHTVIEIPRGSRNKYEYDHKLRIFRLDRVLAASIHYPTAYGFIPGTRAGDGDPLDILVLTSEPTFTGCLIEARPIGLLQMRDGASSDEKILAVSARDHYYDDIEELKDVSPHLLSELENFFKFYKALEGESVQVFGWQDRAAAEILITGCMIDTEGSEPHGDPIHDE